MVSKALAEVKERTRKNKETVNNCGFYNEKIKRFLTTL